jgi:hypothetical protein
MASRTLRNRTVEPSQGDEVKWDWPQDQPEQLNSAPVIDEIIQLSPVELEVEWSSVVGTEDQVARVNTTEKEIITERSSADNTSEIKNMLDGVLGAKQKNNQEVQEGNKRVTGQIRG